MRSEQSGPGLVSSLRLLGSDASVGGPRAARAPLLFGTKVVRPLAKLRIGAARARLVLCHTAFIDGSIPILGRRTALHGSRFQPRTDAVPLRLPSSIVAFRRV